MTALRKREILKISSAGQSITKDALSHDIPAIHKITDKRKLADITCDFIDCEPVSNKKLDLFFVRIAIENMNGKSLVETDVRNLGKWSSERGRIADKVREKFLNTTAKTKRKSFYSSWEWKKIRYDVLIEDGAVCSLCGATKEDGERIVVDHIKPLSKYPELALVRSNLQVLCNSCNMGKSNRDIAS